MFGNEDKVKDIDCAVAVQIGISIVLPETLCDVNEVKNVRHTVLIHVPRRLVYNLQINLAI